MYASNELHRHCICVFCDAGFPFAQIYRSKAMLRLLVEDGANHGRARMCARKRSEGSIRVELDIDLGLH